MSRSFGAIAIAMAALSAAGCTNSLAKLDDTSLASTDDPFSRELATRYEQLATFEERSYDYPTAQHFADKGLTAAAGRPVSPEVVDDWGIDEARKPELRSARAQLMETVARDSRQFPSLAAHAQVNYDCWVEQSSEGWQTDHINNCRNAFRASLQTIADRRIAQATPPAQPAAARGPEETVFFAFDSAVLTTDALNKLSGVAAAVQNGQQPVVVIGNADRAGPPDYNMDLSQERAAAVRQALLNLGIEPERVRMAGRGEYDPAVATADGVPLRENRRAWLDVGQPALAELAWEPPADLGERPQETAPAQQQGLAPGQQWSPTPGEQQGREPGQQPFPPGPPGGSSGQGGSGGM